VKVNTGDKKKDE
jgi:hypothetical protein